MHVHVRARVPGRVHVHGRKQETLESRWQQMCFSTWAINTITSAARWGPIQCAIVPIDS